MKNKLLAWMLCVLLVCSLLPLGAYAESPDAGAAAEADVSEHVIQAGGRFADTAPNGSLRLMRSAAPATAEALKQTIYQGFCSRAEWIELGEASLPESEQETLETCYAEVLNAHPELSEMRFSVFGIQKNASPE